MRKLFSFVLLILILFTLGTQAWAEEKKELVVSAAASLTDALNELKPLFEATHPGNKLLYNFGASGTLTKQIEAGAPVDVFISAAAKQMDQLEVKGLVVKETRQNILSNEVVLILPVNSALGVKSFQDLAGPSVKSIAIGNPDFVPCGQYTREIFESLELSSSLASKLILGGDVRQVLDYVARGEVDAGIVFATDAAILPGKVKVAAVAPFNSHKRIIYPAAVVKSSKNPERAADFVRFLTSKESQEVFKKYGFKIALL